MEMMEISRLILGLRSKGWSDTEIVGFILWIGTCDKQYRPNTEASEDLFCSKENQAYLEQVISRYENSKRQTDEVK